MARYSLRPMKRSALFLLVSAATSAGVSLASAETPTRVGVDQKQQVSFRVTGDSLLVTLRPVDGKANPLAKRLSGKGASIACSGKSPENGKAAVGFQDFTWPKKATTYQGTLNADVSDGLKWCVLEEAKPPRKDLAITYKLRVPNPAASTPAAPAAG